MFDKLYYLSKVQDLQQRYIKDGLTASLDSKRKKALNRSMSQERYLKNYTSFEERVEEDIRCSKIRNNFLMNNPQFANGDTEKFFTPRLIPSKYSSQVKARYQK